MIFRQLFDHKSSTYTYLLAERAGGEALLIDPYIDLMNGLELSDPRLMDIAVPANRSCGLKPAA